MESNLAIRAIVIGTFIGAVVASDRTRTELRYLSTVKRYLERELKQQKGN